MVCELTGAGGLERLALRRRHGARRGGPHGPRATGRDRVLVSEARRSAATSRRCGRIGRGRGLRARRSPADRTADGGSPPVGDDVAAVVVQHPNVFGDPRAGRAGVRRGARRRGARRSRCSTRCRSGVLAPPGELGADIAVAEGQALGNHLDYGGPYLGLIAARMAGRPADARPHRGRDRRRRRTARLRAHAAGPRAAHPPGEGHLEHLHEPDADGDRGDVYLALARAGRARGAGPRSARRRPRYAAERLAALPGARLACPDAAVLQGVRRPARGRPPTWSSRPARRRRLPGRAGGRRGRTAPGRGHRAPHPRRDRRAGDGVRGGRSRDRRRAGPTGRAPRWPRPCAMLRGPAGGRGRSRSSTCPRPTVPAEHRRAEPPGLPEVAERDLVRHYTRLSQINYGSTPASTRSGRAR